ncbi:MAG: HNH endonuclease [Spartobacteria bacterium]|nr:HNH endonuclease [Spartobacteria bacterium]
MNSLERSLIQKAGYDNGWEVVLENKPDAVCFTSAIHKAHARVTFDNGTMQLVIDENPIFCELCRELESEAPEARTFEQLGQLLRRGAQLARALPHAPEVIYNRKVSEALKEPPAGTEVERMVRQRVGQQVFRDSLMDYWGGACAVTGITVPELLRASHIKAWADCTSDADRLNIFNGLLLSAHLDALFDRGLMTFDREGNARFSSAIPATTLKTLNLHQPMRLRWITEHHINFLSENWETLPWFKEETVSS